MKAIDGPATWFTRTLVRSAIFEDGAYHVQFPRLRFWRNSVLTVTRNTRRAISLENRFRK